MVFIRLVQDFIQDVELKLFRGQVELTRWHSSKESACSARDSGSIPGGRAPGVGNGNPLQCSCLENSMDRGVWWAIAHGVAVIHH